MPITDEELKRLKQEETDRRIIVERVLHLLNTNGSYAPKALDEKWEHCKRGEG